MKKIRLLIAALLITSAATAQNQGMNTPPMGGTVFIVDGGVDQEFYEFSSPEKVKVHLREKHMKGMTAREIASAQFEMTRNDGYQSVAPPLFIVTEKSNKFAFAIGGEIKLRTSYDFDGKINNLDFIPADISVPSDLLSRQQLMMDASASRLYFKSIINSTKLGPIETYIDIDFRGGTGYSISGISTDYKPRVRVAYVSFLGFTLGRDVTTFADLHAAPQTIDYQGPNAYSFNYATVLRYAHSFGDSGWSAAIALEQPEVSATYGETFLPIAQRVPDVPLYVQYAFGKNSRSHLRGAAVLRNMYAYNISTNTNTSEFAWGAKLSGKLYTTDKWFLCFNGTYGEGITPYIQDLNDSGLDFTPRDANANSLETPKMWGVQAATSYQITDRLTFTGGYSIVEVDKNQDSSYLTAGVYEKGQYMFGNLFYAVTPRLQLACEYLYGTRENMDMEKNHANRASLMAKFCF